MSDRRHRFYLSLQQSDQTDVDSLARSLSLDQGHHLLRQDRDETAQEPAPSGGARLHAQHRFPRGSREDSVNGRPLEGLCPVCDKTFPCAPRRQGGGSRRKFCSPKCRSLDWSRGNGGKRTASVLKYAAKTESKEKKQASARRATLRKYGWEEEQFLQQLQRQNYSCYGCLKSLTVESARIDHDHKRGHVRGLLCDHCNWTLGHAKDNPATLRRLMAFLDYQREKTNVYLIGALKNPRIPDIGNRLRGEGYDVMDEWFTPGELADTNWQEYERKRGRTYAQALKGRAAQNIFLFDRSYIDHSDIVVLVMPAGKSAMLELGYSGGQGKYTCLFLDGQEPDRYDVMPGVANHVFNTEDELLLGLRAAEQRLFALKEAA